MRCPGFDFENYGFYALGTLDAAESSRIDEHLASGCETCQTAVASAMNVWYAVALTTPEVQPPRSLRRKVLAPFQESKSWWFRPIPAFGFAAALALTLFIGWEGGRRYAAMPTLAVNQSPGSSIVINPSPTIVGGSDKPAVGTPTEVVRTINDPAQTQAIEALTVDLTRERDRVRQLETEVTQRQVQLVAAQDATRVAEQRYRAAADQIVGGQDLLRTVNNLTARTAELERQVVQYRTLLDAERKRVDRSTQMVAMMSDPAIRVVKLRGTEKGEKMQGHALIAGNSQMMFFGSNLPALPAGRTYQLWVLRSSGPAIVSAGTFNGNSGRQASLQFGDPSLLSNITALAITDEPVGGSVLPTGHKWMIGS